MIFCLQSAHITQDFTPAGACRYHSGCFTGMDDNKEENMDTFVELQPHLPFSWGFWKQLPNIPHTSSPPQTRASDRNRNESYMDPVLGRSHTSDGSHTGRDYEKVPDAAHRWPFKTLKLSDICVESNRNLCRFSFIQVNSYPKWDFSKKKTKKQKRKKPR